MNDVRFSRVLARRARHGSRSAAVVLALVVLALVAAYLGTEAVLVAIGAAPLLRTPAALATAAGSGTPLVSGIGAAAVLLGLVALLAALLPGRRARRRIADDRSVVIVDDGVLASAVSRRVAGAARLSATQVRTAIGHRSASVRVRPDSGFPVDAAAASTAAAALLDELAPTPGARARIRVAETGVLS